MRAYVGVITVAEDATDAEEPQIFLGVSSMDCVNKAKAFLTENWEVGKPPCWSDDKIAAYNAAGTGKELTAWFDKHYPYYAYTEHSDELE